MKKFFKRSLLFLVSIIVITVVYFLYFNYEVGVISTGEKIPEYDTVKSALLVIDIQEATTGSLSMSDPYVQKSEELINKINELTEFADSNNRLIIYIYTETDNWFINLLNDTMKKGSVGTQLDSRLNVVSDNVFSKLKLDSFSNSKFEELLIKNKVGRLYFVGLDPAYCINNTIGAAQNRGYEIYVIEDAVVSETDALKNEMFEKFTTNGVSLIKASEYLESAFK